MSLDLTVVAGPKSNDLSLRNSRVSPYRDHSASSPGSFSPSLGDVIFSTPLPRGFHQPRLEIARVRQGQSSALRTHDNSHDCVIELKGFNLFKR